MLPTRVTRADRGAWQTQCGVSRDRIEFRLAAIKGGQIAEIHINGRPLVELWTQASGEGGRWMRAADALWPGRRLWMGDPLPHADLGSGDRRVVLACVDGSTGCGGATVKIEVGDRAVTWSDFRTVPEGTAVTLGPFVFARERYEQALEKAVQKVR